MREKKEPKKWQVVLLYVIIFPVIAIAFLFMIPVLIFVDIPLAIVLIQDKYRWRTYSEVKLLTDKKKFVAAFLLRQTGGRKAAVQCRLRKEKELYRISAITNTRVPKTDAPFLGRQLLYYEYRYRPSGGRRKYSLGEVLNFLRPA